MSERIPPWRAFFADLKRRRVFQIAAVYGGVAFVVLEATDLLVSGLRLPEVTLTVVTIVALFGFPVVVVLRWAFEITPEGEIQPTPPPRSGELEAIAAEPRKKRWAAGLFAMAGFALLIGAGGVALRGALRGPDRGAASGVLPAGSSRAETSVAVLPFSVHGSPDLAYLGEGMVGLLSTKLDGAGELRAIAPPGLLRVVESEGLTPGDPDAARTVADRLGAGLYVTGDVLEAGGRVQLTATLYEHSSGAPVGQGSVEGEVHELFELVDALTARLLSGLSGGPAARVGRIAAVTTSSLPALKSFLEGESLFRHGQFGAAVAAFQRATEEDSLFALAHYRLSLTAEWNLQDELSRLAAEQAALLSDRLSHRDARLLEAFLLRRRGANNEAEDLYRSILGTYPDEAEAWLDLSEVLFHVNPLRGRSFTGSRESLETVLDFDPNHSTALIHLARLAAYEGDLSELDSVVSKFVALHPEPERTLEIEALHAFASADSGRIERLWPRLERGPDLGVALAAWDVAVFARDLPGGQRIAALLTRPSRSSEVRRLGYAWLAQLELAHGRWSRAQDRLDALSELSPGTALEYRVLLSNIEFAPVSRSEAADLSSRLERLDPASIETSDNPSIVFTAHDGLHPLIRPYLLGLAYAAAGDRELALRHADALSAIRLPLTAGSLSADLAHSIRSRLLRAEGRPAEALAELGQAGMETWYGQTLASPLYCQAFERFARAELLFELERFEEALDWYASLVQTSVFETPYLALSHLRQGEIHDRLGDTEAAAEHYSRFVELWRDADPVFGTRVEEAAARLAELRSGS